MPYIDLAGLSRFDAAQKDALARDYALLRDMQWTRSEKAGAVSLWPAGGTPLEPSVDFLFTETPPASGDKSPSNPSTISGVNSVNVGRVGKNLLLRPDRPLSYTGYTLSFNADCSYSVNGSGSLFFSVTDGDAAVSGTSSAVVLDENKTYTLSVKLQSGSVGSQAYLTIGIPSGNAVVIGLPQTAGTTAKQSFSGNIIPDGRFHCRINATENGSFSNAVFFVQLEEGSSETAFEEPMSISDANYTLPLGSTYYGGTLDVSTGVLTVTSGGHVFTGEEDFRYHNTSDETYSVFQLFSVAPDNNKVIYSTCSHFPYDYYLSDAPSYTLYTSSGTIRVKTLASDFSSVSSFLTWLSQQYANGTPMKIAWNCNSSVETIQLTPVQISALLQQDKYTPRLNTVYTDAQAVQVGYVKSPIREEYELTQAITAQGGNV